MPFFELFNRRTGTSCGVWIAPSAQAAMLAWHAEAGHAGEVSPDLHAVGIGSIILSISGAEIGGRNLWATGPPDAARIHDLPWGQMPGSQGRYLWTVPQVSEPGLLVGAFFTADILGHLSELLVATEDTPTLFWRIHDAWDAHVASWR